MPGTVTGPPSVSLSCELKFHGGGVEHLLADQTSVANNFWGKDDAGVGPMLDRMHNAKITCDELKSFYSSMCICSAMI